MPDFTMCSYEQCPLAETCKRHPKSGTKPHLYRQSWCNFKRCLKEGGKDCKMYWGKH